MDFFDEKKRREKNVRKAGEKLGSNLSTPEARQKAIELLQELGTEEAILMLLQRFKSRISSEISDREEKEYVLGLVVGFGAKSLGPIREFLKREDEIRFPLAALDQLAERGESIELVTKLLAEIGLPLPRQRSKAMQLLRFLEDHPDERIPPVVLPLLRDDGSDDDLRVAAANVLGRQAETDEIREALMETLTHEETSLRLRNAIVELLVETGWGVQGFRKKVETLLPEGHVIDRGGAIRRAGNATEV